MYKVYFHVLGLVCFNACCIDLHSVFVFDLVLLSFVISIECFFPSCGTSGQIPVSLSSSSFLSNCTLSNNSSCSLLPFIEGLWPYIQIHDVIVGSFVKSFTELFDKKGRISVVLESCRQVVESHDIIVDFIAFLFEFIELTCGIFFDCHVNKTIDE